MKTTLYVAALVITQVSVVAEQRSVLLPDGRIIFVDVPYVSPARSEELRDIAKELKNLNRQIEQDRTDREFQEVEATLERDKQRQNAAFQQMMEATYPQKPPTSAAAPEPLKRQTEPDAWWAEQEQNKQEFRARIDSEREQRELEWAKDDLRRERQRIEEERRRLELLKETPREAERKIWDAIRADPKLKPALDEYNRKIAEIEKAEKAEREAKVAEEAAKKTTSKWGAVTESLSSIWKRLFQ